MGWVQNPQHKKLNMAQLIKGAKFDFLKYSKLVFIGSSVFILIGAAIFVQKKETLFGMDSSKLALTSRQFLKLSASKRQN